MCLLEIGVGKQVKNPQVWWRWIVHEVDNIHSVENQLTSSSCFEPWGVRDFIRICKDHIEFYDDLEEQKYLPDAFQINIM